MIMTYSNTVACEPPTNTGVERKVIDGVARTIHRSSLTPLKTVFHTKTIPAGSTVYVHASVLMNNKFATEILEIDGQKFILVPETFVLLTDTVDMDGN